ncbi:MAG: HEPN domain-containing protein [Lachnospiraceae bacterium]|nr:HEPN domain-containing protein [Lachnospiraceae bacterium]
MSSDDIGTGKDLAVYRLEKAEQCLSDAETLFNKGSYEGAVNRSYYCIYHSIRSILALDEVEFKRHSGNISYFRQNYIKTGIFDKSLSVIVGSAFDTRSDSDYEDYISFSSEDAKKQLENAKKFLSVINDYVKDNTNE